MMSPTRTSSSCSVSAVCASSARDAPPIIRPTKTNHSPATPIGPSVPHRPTPISMIEKA